MDAPPPRRPWKHPAAQAVSPPPASLRAPLAGTPARASVPARAILLSGRVMRDTPHSRLARPCSAPAAPKKRKEAD